MCGISGIILNPTEHLEQDILHKMAEAMAARGPDASGIYHRAYYGLSHRRLKIIDLSDQANQPMLSEDRKLSIVFNGEIYNFREIRANLMSRGRHFRTNSDTEVILSAFEEWGTQSFELLNGIFSFGILDERKKSPALYLVRDRFGIKPLFFTHRAGRFAFASTLRPLALLDWVDRTVDPQIMYQYLQLSHIPSPASIFTGIRQLVGGTWLCVEEGKLRQGTFWSPSELIYGNFGEKSGEVKSEEEWMTELDQTFARVMKRQLISDVPVGCFLSGGIDSTLLASTYASIAKNKIQTFSIGYKETEFNETEHARLVATMLGADHEEWIIEPRDLFDLIPNLPKYLDQPFADPSVLPTLLLMKFSSKKVTVGFSGDGGDELFFGYTYQEILYRLGLLRRIPKELRKTVFDCFGRFLSLLNRGFPSLTLQRLIKFSDIFQYKNEAELFQYFIGTIGPMRMDKVAALIIEPIQSDPPLYTELLDSLSGASWEDKISQIFMRTFLVDTVLAKTDRASMAFGLEARVPFLDNEMAEFSRRLPFHYKYKNGVKKYILRSLLRKQFPSSIHARRKQGFSMPLRDWLRGELKYLLDEYLNETRLKKEGIFHSKQVQELIKQHVGGYGNHSHLLWSLISFQLWKENY